ncbi:exlusion protein FxsA, partial [Vibrio cholerae]
EGLSTRGVSSPIEPRWLQLLCLGLVLCVASPLGGRYSALEYSESMKWKV